MRAQVRGKIALEVPALRPLVVHLTRAGDQRAVAGRVLVGVHDLVGIVQQRRHAQDRRVHRGHRDMAVERALAVVFEQQRRQLALDVQQRQAGALGAGADQRRRTDPAHRLRDACAAQRLDADQRVLAAADRDQRVRREAESGRGAGGVVAVAGKELQLAAQLQMVAVGELAQAQFVDLGEQRLQGRLEGLRGAQ